MSSNIDIYQANILTRTNVVKLRYMFYVSERDHSKTVDWCEKQFGPVGNAERWWYDSRFRCIWVNSEEDRTLVTLALSKK